MNRSLLQLKHYHFITLALSAREDFNPARLAGSEGPYPDFESIQLEPVVSLFSNEEAGECGPYLLRLAVAYEPEADEFPYSFEAVVEGVFELAKEAEIVDYKKIVVINGASMLYSAAREQLVTLSGRHLYGPMLLPSLDFRHLDV